MDTKLNCTFPFNQMVDEKEFLDSIWNCYDNKNVKLLNDHKYILKSHSDSADGVVNCDPENCKFVALQEFANSVQMTDGVSVLQLNCRSVASNFTKITSFVEISKKYPSVVAVSETWLRDGDEVFYNLPGYRFVSKPRLNKRGGGVGLFIQSSFSTMYCLTGIVFCMTVSLLPILNLFLPQQCQSNNCKSFYRPPNMNIVDFNKSWNIFRTDLVQYKKKKGAILVGDFNINLLKVDNHAGNNEFYNSMISYGFFPTIIRPTSRAGLTAVPVAPWNRAYLSRGAYKSRNNFLAVRIVKIYKAMQHSIALMKLVSYSSPKLPKVQIFLQQLIALLISLLEYLTAQRNNFEQIRQTAVATDLLAISNEYTGRPKLRECFAISYGT